MIEPKVLIVGAGPTGLVLALQLAERGISFRIIDKNSGPGHASRALIVHARTLELYRQMGFADNLIARGTVIEHLQLRQNHAAFADLNVKDLGRDLSPYPYFLGLAQDVHETFLVERLQRAGVTIEWGVELVDVAQDENCVRVRLHRDGEDTRGQDTWAAFDYLCGCDGARSTVRRQIGVEFPGGTYEHLYFVADVKLAEQPSAQMVLDIAEDMFAIMMPVRTSETHRLIGIVPDDLAIHSELKFSAIQQNVERILKINVLELNWFSTYRVHHRVASKFKLGRCFLAGDAGHLHSPAGGQGLNTGIGDAVNLAWKIAEVLKGRAGIDLLDTYEPERIAFARKLVATTDRAFQGMVGRTFVGFIVRNWFLPHVVPVLSKLTAFRRELFRAVSQVRINYRQSALSEGRLGRVSGGDRLPWAATGATDSFAPLRSMTWQVHVYGKASPAFASSLASLNMPLHELPWNGSVQEAGIQRDAFYLIRPDGYIAVASPTQDVERVRAFISRHRLVLEHHQSGVSS